MHTSLLASVLNLLTHSFAPLEDDFVKLLGEPLLTFLRRLDKECPFAITAFNKKGENTYMLINKDSETDSLMDLVVWVPTILYVEKGEVKLVTFGLLENAQEIQTNADIAFNRGE